MVEMPVHNDRSLLAEVRAARELPEPSAAAEIRRAAGITQSRLAAELDVTRVTVARWESGIRQPRGGNRRRYAELLLALERELQVGRRQTQTRMRALRKARGWSLDVLGTAAGIQPSRLSALERRLAVPSERELARLSEYLEWPAGELLDEVDEASA